MMYEYLLGGGKLVNLASGGLAVEGVAGAKRGMVVTSACSWMDGQERKAGQYRLTKRVIAGTDMWHVQRLGAAVVR
jgi:hypothetical protein